MKSAGVAASEVIRVIPVSKLSSSPQNPALRLHWFDQATEPSCTA
jgi:hypothetical protein